MIRIRTGDRLAQLRIFYGDPVLPDDEINDAIKKGEIVVVPDSVSPTRVSQGIHFGVNLHDAYDKTIGYYNRPNYQPIELSQSGAHSSRAFWDRIHFRGSTDVILEPDRFYLFASSQLLGLGPSVCAEMLPYDAGMGELRSHYAGFFDSGFGWGHPSRIVLEVRNHHVPYMLSHGQTLFRVHIMRNTSSPEQLYGEAGRGSHYQGQGLRLAKQFMRTETETADLSDYVPLGQGKLFGS
jgi:dCTP deaminase